MAEMIFVQSGAAHVCSPSYIVYSDTICCCTYADVSCTSGCTCEDSILEGHWEEKASQLDQHNFVVSQVCRKVLATHVFQIHADIQYLSPADCPFLAD